MTVALSERPKSDTMWRKKSTLKKNKAENKLQGQQKEEKQVQN